MLNSRHLEFQISSTQSKFLDLLKRTLFTLKIVSKRVFFSEWGCGPCRARASADALAPHSLKKFVMKRFSMKKTFLWKVKEFTLSRADLKFKMSRILQTSRKINFGFVQIGSRFNYNMKIFFVALNNYLDKLDSHVCITVLKNLILVFFSFSKLAQI